MTWSARTARRCTRGCRCAPERLAACQSANACSTAGRSSRPRNSYTSRIVRMGLAIRSRWWTSKNRSSPMRPRANGVLHADPEVLRHLGAELVEVAIMLRGGKMVDTMLAHDGTDFAGSWCVITKRSSGYAARIASRWKLWCGALNSHRSGGRREPAGAAATPPVVRRSVAVRLDVPPPGVVAVDRHRELLPVEGHPEDLAVLHGGVEVAQVQGPEASGESVSSSATASSPAVDRSPRPPAMGGGPGLPAPTAQAAELRIQRHHVGEGRGAGAWQPVDVDRAPYGRSVTLRDGRGTTPRPRVG